jgi:hypothetical protein
MNQKFTILNIIIVLLEYPLFSLFKGNLKKEYSKNFKKEIEKLKILLKTDQKSYAFTKEFDGIQKNFANFILSHQHDFSEEQKGILAELNNCLLQMKDETLNLQNKIFSEVSFSFILEKLKQNQTLNDILQDTNKKAKDWEYKAEKATQYGQNLNVELEHITGDINNLLKTIKTLKAQLTLEESRREILTEEKKALTEELAIEKEKK